MKEGWKYSTIEDCCNIDYGTRVVRKNVTGIKYPVYGGGGETFRMDEYNREDCLVISRFAMSKKCTRLVKGKFFLNDSGLTLSPKSDVGLLRSLLERYILACNDTIYSYGRGSAQRNLNMNEFRQMPVSYPTSIEEQHRIVTYLDSAFAKIDALKKNAEKMLNEAKALFAAALKEAMTPQEGWEEKTLKEICQVINGRAYLKPEMLNSGKYKLLRVGNFFTNDKWYYTDLELDENKYCEEGDLLYAWSASFGPKIWHGEKVVYHYHIWKMICNETIIDRLFMYYWLDSDELKKQTMTGLHGSTMAHITKNIIEKCIVRFPPLSTQQRIVAHLDTLSAKVRQLEENYKKTIAECDAMKQAILRETFE